MAWTYEEAQHYLDNFTNNEVKATFDYNPEVLSLDRPRDLLARLGSPQARYPIIHVAGTKGKGSVSMMCASALQAAGLRVGLYTSPHMQSLRERFRLNGQMIGTRDFTALVGEMQPIVENIPGLSWFEITTALAFLFFARHDVDVVVSEVGLGGRLDATNVVNPIVSVITSLSYDHMKLLGETLPAIAAEKAGIIKPGVPVISAPQPPEALAVIREAAQQNNAPLTVIGQDWHYAISTGDKLGQHFAAAPAGEPLRQYWTQLIGTHQAINGAVTLAALDAARKAGLAVSESAAAAGLADLNWPGRFEIAGTAPALVLDVAHNGASAAHLNDTLNMVFGESGDRILIFGTSLGKDVAGMFKALLPDTAHLILAEADHARATPADTLAELARSTNFSGTITKAESIAAALDRAYALAGNDSLIVVSGSLFVVGNARDALGLEPGQTRPLNAAAAALVTAPPRPPVYAQI